MADFEAAYDAIMGRIKSSFVTLRPTVPIAWPNLHFDPRTSFVPANHTAWVRVSILGDESRQATIGGYTGQRWRTWGQVQVQVFAPLGAGANTALAVADDVATALRGASTGGVVLQAASVRPIGRDPDGEFYQVNVIVPFRVDLVA